MDDIGEAWRILATPPGAEWSGRARYAAAMTLHKAGLIEADVLEIFRISARLDHEDPASLLDRWKLGGDVAARIRALRTP